MPDLKKAGCITLLVTMPALPATNTITIQTESISSYTALRHLPCCASPSVTVVKYFSWLKG